MLVGSDLGSVGTFEEEEDDDDDDDDDDVMAFVGSDFIRVPSLLSALDSDLVSLFALCGDFLIPFIPSLPIIFSISFSLQLCMSLFSLSSS